MATQQEFSSFDIIDALERKDIETFSKAIADPMRNVFDIDFEIGSSIFECVLKTPKSARFINACLDKRNLSPDESSFHFLSCLASLCPENLAAFTEKVDVLSKKHDLQQGLHMLAMVASNNNYDNVLKCLTILFGINLKNKCDGLEVNPDIGLDPPLVELLKRCHDLPDSGKEMLKLMMKKSFIGPFKCDEIYNGESPFSFNATHMKTLLEDLKEVEFINSYKYFIRRCELLEKHLKKVENYNKVGPQIDKISQSDDVRKVVTINSDNKPEEVEKFLMLATESTLNSAVKFIMVENPTLIEDITKWLQVTCDKGNHEILEYVLSKMDSSFKISGLHLLHKVCEKLHRQQSDNRKINFPKCFSLLVDKYPMLVHEIDDKGNFPLHIAVTSKRNKNEIVRLLQEGSSVTAKNQHNIRPIDSISRKALEEFLDSRVTYENDDTEIEIDYNFLLEDPKLQIQDETFLLERIRNNLDLRPLVAHPVLSSFIFLKWWKLRFYTCMNFALILCFIIAMTTFVYSSRHDADDHTIRSVKLYSRIVFAAFTIILALREMFQVLTSSGYFKSLINYLEWTLICCSAYCIIEGFNKYAAFPLFIISGYELYKLIGTLPFLSLSIYMAILEKVMKTFLKSIGVFIIIPLSFALSFNTLYFNDETGSNNSTEDGDAYNSFQNPYMSFIKVLAMMTGEFDSGSLGLDTSVTTSVFFVFFMFVVTIVLFNLLNALAISDTQDILNEGEIADLSLKIKVLNDQERSMNRVDCLSVLRRKILSKLSVFQYFYDGKVSIVIRTRECISRKIETKLPKSSTVFSEDLESGYARGHCSAMNEAILEKLHTVISDKTDREEKEKEEAELVEKIKNIEKILLEKYRD